jgi:RNA polymerase sigma-70 factor (ECF subfamily)
MTSGPDPLITPAPGQSFDELVVPHLDAGRRLARWRMQNEHDAEDVMQEASLRAFRYFQTFTGGNARAWFLRIVHNTCCAWRSRRVQPATDPFDEEHHSGDGAGTDPEALFLHGRDMRLIEDAMSHLPPRLQRLLVLRELEGLSYQELADALRIPIGTVMSRLSRARRALRDAVDDRRRELAARAGLRAATGRAHERSGRGGLCTHAGEIGIDMPEEGL